MEQTIEPVTNSEQKVPSKIPPRDSGTFKSIVTTILIIIAAPLTAVIITSFVFQSYEVFGPSMQQTLHEGDRLIVVKAPRTWAKIRNKNFEPKRGDVVVFVKKDLFIAGEMGNKQLIKRVIALPGERVVSKNGIVTVYNEKHPDGYQPDKDAEWSDSIQKSNINGEWTVNNGEIFVCGDNRNNSLDSRTFGPIKESDLVGIASFRFLPTDKARAL
ncbi:signal peptidase I [bacterium]|nr:signal peptidase I [bacterium]NBX97603.1 signal peptidase I [bacterium]NDC94558.1 signal peptidase I [bacterium]NDD84147.1 signal peptidase I [bacterium]NDG29966.1 signal peptidase I [bacterium]